MRHPNDDRLGPWDLLFVIVLAVLAFALFTDRCSAEDAPVATPSPAPTIRWSTSAGYQSLFRRGEDRKFYIFGRAQIDVPLSELHAIARLDKSAETKEKPDLGALATTQFDTLEVTVGLYRHVLGPLHVAALYSYSRPLQGGIDSYPQTYGAGVFVGAPSSGRWLFAGAGQDDVSGGLAGLIGWQIPIDGRLTSVGDVKGSSLKAARAHVGVSVAVTR